MSQDTSLAYAHFYRLPIDQRAVLFLKHKTRFKCDELEEIVGLFRHCVIAHLFNAREKITGGECHRADGSAPLPTSVGSECLHSRNMFAAIDTEQTKSMARHMDSCQVCRESYTQVQKIIRQIDAKIPWEQGDWKDREQLAKGFVANFQRAAAQER